MNTKIVMTASAACLFAAGIIFSFMPHETAAIMLWSEQSAIVIQMLGAVYFGFGMVNWTARANLIGGIYGRPIAIGNFTHFSVASLALVKFILSQSEKHAALLFLSGLYLILAILFGYILFTHPLIKTKQ